MVTTRFVVMFIAILSGLAMGQTKTTTAAKVPAGGITIDGSLDEYYWVSDAVGEKIKIDNTMLTDGVIDNDADCHAYFKTLWGDNGIYVGTWFYDDVHNAMNSQYLDAANIAYDDDGLEYWFDYNFEDAWNSSASSPELYYLQLVKGFGNLDHATQHGGWWGGDDGSGKGWSTGLCDKPTQEAMGWREVFTSADGLNYTSEFLIEWSGSIMHQQTGMSQGGAIAFDMKVNDNDGAVIIDGAMHWTGITHTGYNSAHWGKVILGSPAGIKPIATKAFRMQQISGHAVFDILGRKMTTPLSAQTAIQINASNTKVFRRITLR